MNPRYQTFLYNLGLFNIKLGLATITSILEKLGSPHHHPGIIHLAGTNGKGSTLVTLENLLLKSGYTTGSTISPHLVSIDERFRVNGCQVDSSEVDRAFTDICGICGIDSVELKPGTGNERIKPTFFEFIIAMAFSIFKRRGVDYILLETGLGGRLDATNVVPKPLACVLTRIDMDHQEFLGESQSDITNEKLGILKSGAPVFIAAQKAEVLSQIVETCNKRGVDYSRSPAHFGIQRSETERTSLFYLKTGKQRDKVVVINRKEIGLRGDHQLENISTALAVYLSIVPSAGCLSDGKINQTLRQLRWPGRLEYVTDTVLIDGAHNELGVSSLFAYLEKRHPGERILLALGWMKKKELIHAMCSTQLEKIEFLPVCMKTDRAEGVETVYTQLTEKGLTVHPWIHVKELPAGILRKTLPRHELLVISGSLYLLGEFLDVWTKSTGQKGG